MTSHGLIRRALLAGLLLLPATLHAGQIIKIGFPETVPPWVNAGGQSGIAIDLLRSALKAEGLTLQAEQHPFARRLQAYRHGQLDGLYDISASQQKSEQLNGSISRPLHSFDNIAVGLAKRQLPIERAADLMQWRVMAWEGAANVLPASYDRLEALANGASYHEEANQQRQVRSLFAGRVDVILSDRLAFEWQRRQLKADTMLHSDQPIHIYAVLPPNEVGVLFRDSGLRARIDARIKTLKAGSHYQEIFARYGSQPQP